jgi:hypothetical protein
MKSLLKRAARAASSGFFGRSVNFAFLYSEPASRIFSTKDTEKLQFIKLPGKDQRASQLGNYTPALIAVDIFAIVSPFTGISSR